MLKSLFTYEDFKMKKKKKEKKEARRKPIYYDYKTLIKN
jgi:hypothetical protein